MGFFRNTNIIVICIYQKQLLKLTILPFANLQKLPFVTALSQRYYNVTTMLPQRYHHIPTMLPWCYHNVTILLSQCCHDVTTTLSRRCKAQTCNYNFPLKLLLIKIIKISYLNGIKGSDRQCMVENWDCSIIKKFFLKYLHNTAIAVQLPYSL